MVDRGIKAEKGIFMIDVERKQTNFALLLKLACKDVY